MHIEIHTPPCVNVESFKNQLTKARLDTSYVKLPSYDASLNSRLAACSSVLYFLLMDSHIWHFCLFGIGLVPSWSDNRGSTVVSMIINKQF